MAFPSLCNLDINCSICYVANRGHPVCFCSNFAICYPLGLMLCLHSTGRCRPSLTSMSYALRCSPAHTIEPTMRQREAEAPSKLHQQGILLSRFDETTFHGATVKSSHFIPKFVSFKQKLTFPSVFMWWGSQVTCLTPAALNTVWFYCFLSVCTAVWIHREEAAVASGFCRNSWWPLNQATPFLSDTQVRTSRVRNKWISTLLFHNPHKMHHLTVALNAVEPNPFCLWIPQDICPPPILINSTWTPDITVLIHAHDNIWLGFF